MIFLLSFLILNFHTYIDENNENKGSLVRRSCYIP